jgi:hydrogenase expression/formation protein HypE
MDEGTHKPAGYSFESATCPLPLQHHRQIVLGHGSGGKLSHDLIGRLFIPGFDSPVLKVGDDAGVVELSGGERLAISTDSHVVSPLFYPGGDIGRLAVCGTVNDVSAKGADPRWITAGFILEEGLETDILVKVVASMQAAAYEAGVTVVAGDTKVVQKGLADGLYINTAGIGLLRPGLSPGGARAAQGDQIILTGSLGNHGMAVLSARGDLGLSSTIASDNAPLNHLVRSVLDTAGEAVHVMRDPTRGGLATTLNEIARQSGQGILINETAIPVSPPVQAACEMLGFDPLYVANEGKLVIFVRPELAQQALEAARGCRYGEGAVIIGEVGSAPPGMVLMRTAFGSTRVVDMLAGEILPRIC